MQNSIKKKILLINDMEVYNRRYRSGLITELQKIGNEIYSFGLFEGIVGFISSFIRLASKNFDLVISSNLKTNIFVLLIRRRKALVIINGLGRYRRISFARWVLCRLISARPRTSVIVQNYADYRYLLRNSRKRDITWVPGSGGRSKLVGPENVLVIVQRDKKLPLVYQSVRDFFEANKEFDRLAVVGCENSMLVESYFRKIEHKNVGYVDSDIIFAEGGSFLQPTGYGEGFPHTLADALVSGMKVFIDNREYIRYGLYKIGAKRLRISPSWSLVVSSEQLINCISSRDISRKTARIAEAAIRGAQN